MSEGSWGRLEPDAPEMIVKDGIPDWHHEASIQQGRTAYAGKFVKITNGWHVSVKNGWEPVADEPTVVEATPEGKP